MKLNDPIPENIMIILNTISGIILWIVFIALLVGFLWAFITLQFGLALFLLILIAVFHIALTINL